MNTFLWKMGLFLRLLAHLPLRLAFEMRSGSPRRDSQKPLHDRCPEDNDDGIKAQGK